MTKTRNNSVGLLAEVNLPLYAIEMLSNSHVIVAGGGGSSKTGIANGFIIYKIYYNGTRFCAEEVGRLETGGNVVMNFDIRDSYLCAGKESHCQIYYLSSEKDQEQAAQSDFKIKPFLSLQTDFATTEPLQRVIRISPNGRIMATGGTDGHFRIRSFPQMVGLNDVAAHTKEIDDLDFSPDSTLLVTISKDGLGCVWLASTFQLKCKLQWNAPKNGKYLYKRCRYGITKANQNKYWLFIITNPHATVGKHRAFLQQWECSSVYKIHRTRGIDESLASLAVRNDGRFVAVGTMCSGSVSIFIASNLQRVLHIPHAHSMFVTGLQFLPITNAQGTPIFSGTDTAAVLSISVDNKICIHSLPKRKSFPTWVAMFFIIAVGFVTFILSYYFPYLKVWFINAEAETQLNTLR